MDKRLSTGRLITDRLILKSLKGAAVSVAVWGGLGYACHFIAERSRAEESAIEAKIAVARRVLADTVGEPSAGGGANCQRLRRALDEAQSIVAEVNRFGENAIAEKYSEAEDKCKRITSSAKNEASTLLEQLKQLKTDYASARGDFNRKFTVVDKAKDAIQKRDSLEQKLNQYRIGLKGVIDESERESSSGSNKHLLDSLEFMNVHFMSPSEVIAKACSEVEKSWSALFDSDNAVADMIGQLEAAKRDIRSKAEELNTFVASAENLHTRFMQLPEGETWPHPQEWYRNECRVIGDNVRHFTNGPYNYDRSKSNWILNKISELEGKIDSEDVLESVELHKRIQEAYHDFASKCTWRQGVAHPKVAHVISSSTPNHWAPESGWEFIYPGTSNLAVRRKAPTWSRPKEWFERECSVIEKNVGFYTSGGYRYPRGGDANVLRKIQNLRQRLNANDPEGSTQAHSELKAVYDTFVNQCQWTSGLRHPRFPHVVSGMTANQWVAENGWEFVNPGTSDFSVRRKPVQVRCDACRGNGYVVQKTNCNSCNGRGRVPNPAAQVGQVVNAVGGLVDAFGGRRRGRPVPRIPQGPSEIDCSACKGRGYRQENIPCDKCKGSRVIYKYQ